MDANSAATTLAQHPRAVLFLVLLVLLVTVGAVGEVAAAPSCEELFNPRGQPPVDCDY